MILWLDIILMEVRNVQEKLYKKYLKKFRWFQCRWFFMAWDRWASLIIGGVFFSMAGVIIADAIIMSKDQRDLETNYQKSYLRER